MVSEASVVAADRTDARCSHPTERGRSVSFELAPVAKKTSPSTHRMTIDRHSAERVEVVHGPASLLNAAAPEFRRRAGARWPPMPEAQTGRWNVRQHAYARGQMFSAAQ